MVYSNIVTNFYSSMIRNYGALHIDWSLTLYFNICFKFVSKARNKRSLFQNCAALPCAAIPTFSSSAALRCTTAQRKSLRCEQRLQTLPHRMCHLLWYRLKILNIFLLKMLRTHIHHFEVRNIVTMESTYPGMS